MGSRAVHQMPIAVDTHSSDVVPIVRPLGGGLFEDRSIPRADIGYQVLPAVAFLTSAQVLALNTTPVTILIGQPGMIIIPRQVILSLDGASTDYTTNTLALVGTASLIDDTNYTMSGGLPVMAGDTVLFPGFISTGQVTSIAAGDDLAISVKTGNPAAGDGDIIVTTYYELIDPNA